MAQADAAWLSEPKTSGDTEDDGFDLEVVDEEVPSGSAPGTRSSPPPPPTSRKRPVQASATEKGRSTRAKINAEVIHSDVDQLANGFSAAADANTAATVKKVELRHEYRKHKLNMKAERRKDRLEADELHKKNKFNAAMEVYKFLYAEWDAEGRIGQRPTPPAYE
jgi:hypothetical protein